MAFENNSAGPTTAGVGGVGVGTDSGIIGTGPGPGNLADQAVPVDTEKLWLEDRGTERQYWWWDMKEP